MPILAHKIRLTPTPDQEIYFKKACGTARFAYNWALNEWKIQDRARQKPSISDLKKQFNAIKHQHFPWVREVTKCSTEGAFRHLDDALKRFFSGKTKYPKFKKKGEKDSFYLANDRFRVKENGFYLPKIGWVRMTEALRFSGRLLSATVSRIADKWFISFNVELPTSPYPTCENQARVGVDVGIKTLATLSTGETFENPNALKRYERRLKRYQRQVSRKQKGSRNRDKAKMKVARLHYRIACIRKDATHKVTTYLTQTFKTIVLEDLNVKGMVKNHKLAKAISNANLSELHRQIEYKSGLRQNHVEHVDRFYPSSKTCSACGIVKPDLTLADRVFVCPSCGMVRDRDINAAINLDHYSVGKGIPELTPAE